MAQLQGRGVCSRTDACPEASRTVGSRPSRLAEYAMCSSATLPRNQPDSTRTNAASLSAELPSGGGGAAETGDAVKCRGRCQSESGHGPGKNANRHVSESRPLAAALRTPRVLTWPTSERVVPCASGSLAGGRWRPGRSRPHPRPRCRAAVDPRLETSRGPAATPRRRPAHACTAAADRPQRYRSMARSPALRRRPPPARRRPRHNQPVPLECDCGTPFGVVSTAVPCARCCATSCLET